MRIAQPGFYDIAEAEYHADPCVEPSASSGLLSTIINSTIADAWWSHPRLNPAFEAEDKTQYDLGSVAHVLMLGKGAEIEVIHYDDWRKTAAKDQRDAALVEGKQPCLVGVYDQACEMVEAARKQLRGSDNSDAFLEGKGVAEQSAIWQFEASAGPIWCRNRMDWMHSDEPLIWDYKTFKPGAEPEGFGKYLFREARALQDPFYSMGWGSVHQRNWMDVQFRYVVQSTDAPYVLCVVQLDDEARDLAWRQAVYALERWGHATKSGRFHGYLPRTHFVGAPSYELTRWEGRIAAEEHAAALDRRAA